MILQISEDDLLKIESEIGQQLSAEAYQATENIKDGNIQFTTFKLMLNSGLRGMRLFLEKLQDNAKEIDEIKEL